MSDSARLDGVLHFDGSCDPNPGPSSGGFVLRMSNGTMSEKSVDFGPGTCNTAEYRALIEGLTEALARGVTHIEIYGDSQLVIRGVKRGPWKKGKPHLELLKAQSRELVQRFANAELIWVPREENADAHQLSVTTAFA